MASRIRQAVFLATLFVCLVVVCVSHSAGIPERPLNYVVDLAGIVDDATENRLNGYLQELEQKDNGPAGCPDHKKPRRSIHRRFFP